MIIVKNHIKKEYMKIKESYLILIRIKELEKEL